MENVFDVLKERGYIAQCTDEEELRDLLGKQKVTFYIGFDPTADSLHVGHFLALMAMAHMQRAGHRPICMVGGGTGTVGDPSGRTDMRKMLTDEQIEKSCRALKPILIKVPNAEVTLYHSNNGIGMTATATTAQIVTPKTNE